jgi:glyoxylase-like metal-dependent hydrolase (beta-lactamase superfamily II)
VYALDVLIPTARFAFAVVGERVEVLPEHRSPEGHAAIDRLRAEQRVVGMTTFPNTSLLRGERTFVVDPGLHLQNEPVLGALEVRGVTPAAVDAILLTHAHLDHAGACADLPLPVVVHEAETREPHWAAVSGILETRPLTLLRGEEGEVAPGLAWALTGGHTAGGVTFFVETADGVAALCGDIVGPYREDFDRMTPPDDPCASQLVASWELIRARRPSLIVAGHVPPFRLDPSGR